MTDCNEVASPGYDGNGMFRSFGNVLVDPRVALLLIDFAGSAPAAYQRQRPQPGRRSVARKLRRCAIDEVRASQIFPNCARYIYRMPLEAPSVYVPRAGYTPPAP